MAIVYNRTTTGLWKNGAAQLKSNTDWSSYSYTTSDSLSNGGCFAVDYDVYGGGTILGEYIEVDPSKKYQFAVSVKGTALNYNNKQPGGHLGFACYDKNFSFIDLRNCGDVGNNYLSRAASPGDSAIYLENSGISGWYQGDSNAVTANRAYYRQILFFPSTHPDYGTAHKYTRFNNRSYYQAVQQPEGDWKLDLDSNIGSQTGTFTTTTLPDYGYSLPAGTPVSRGVAGGTYNYAVGNPNHAIGTWATYTTGVFTGENRNSSTPFRYSTKYIRFLNLRNYNIRTETGGSGARYILDNILFVERPNGIALPTSYLQSDRIR